MKYTVNGIMPIFGYVTWTAEVDIPSGVDVETWLNDNMDIIRNNLSTDEADWRADDSELEINDFEQTEEEQV